MIRTAALAAMLFATFSAKPAALAKPAPKAAPPVEVDVDVESCGRPPAADADWFFLGAPGDHPNAVDARRAYRAVYDALDGDRLARDPRCLHVAILDHDALMQRSRRIDKRDKSEGFVGFHTAKLGADSTVFVEPKPGQGLDVVITHEVLHSLSHRFTYEAQRHRLQHMVEGATEFLTRDIAEVSLGVPKKSFRTGYGIYVAFYEALLARLGKDGLAVLGTAYFNDGYDAFEAAVDDRLGPGLREAAHALEKDQLAEALQRLPARAGTARRPRADGRSGDDRDSTR